MKDELKVVSSEPIELDGDEHTSKDTTKNSSNDKSKDPTSNIPAKPETPMSDKPGADTKRNDKPSIEDNTDNQPPPAPPRPVDELTKIKGELKSAFPSTNERIITGILIASQGDLDLSFNALLYINDETIEEPEIPIKPEVPPKPIAKDHIELTDDEKLARQLQKEFEMEDRRRRRREKRQQQSLDRDDESPDEFEVIKQNFNQGLEEAKTTLNGWVSGLAKKFEVNQDYNDNNKGNKDNQKLFGALGGSLFKKNRFDEDPKILDNDFHEKINLNDNDVAPSLPKRKPNMTSNDDITTTKIGGETSSSGPATTSAPVNSDAFLVDDSDDDDDKKDIKL